MDEVIDAESGQQLRTAAGVSRDSPDPYQDDDCHCGLKTKMIPEKEGGNRISGGHIVTPNKFPWVVRIVGGCAASKSYCEDCWWMCSK